MITTQNIYEYKTKCAINYVTFDIKKNSIMNCIPIFPIDWENTWKILLSTAPANCGKLLLEILEISQMYLHFQHKMARQFLLSCILSIIVATSLGISKIADVCCYTIKINK